jgi:hypothetical protein
MEDDSLSGAEIQKKPYVLLVDPSGTRAAAYNGQHRLMHADASKKLLAWTLAHHAHSAPWDDQMDRHYPRARAAWMPTGSLAGWTLYWLRDGKTTDAQIRATPSR